MPELIFDESAWNADVAEQDQLRGELANSTTFNPPPAAAAVGSWTDWLKPAGQFVTGIANTAGQILSARDAIAAQREQSTFDRMLRSAQLDLAKYQVTSGSALEKAKLDAALATQRAAGTGQTSLFGIPIASGGSSSNMLLLAGVAFGVYMFAKKH